MGWIAGQCTVTRAPVQLAATKTPPGDRLPVTDDRATVTVFPRHNGFAMALQFDHVFIITAPGADAGDKLLALGMVEGESNTHAGQGSANRRFFLNGLMLELLFIADADEAANGAGRGLGLLQRAEQASASPFGIIARVADPAQTPAFDNWQYQPDYFPAGLCFFVGVNSAVLQEPLCICMPLGLPVKRAVRDDNPDWMFTSAEFTVPGTQYSSVLQHFAEIDSVSVAGGAHHHLHLTFNSGKDSRTADLTPALPLTISW